MTKTKPVIIFRTKGGILTARDMGNIKIADEVIQDFGFKSAKMTDLLAFKLISGSDYTAIEVKSVQNNPEIFMDLALGKLETSIETENH